MISDELEALVLADSVGALDAEEQASLQSRFDALTPDQRSEVARIYEAGRAVAMSAQPASERQLTFSTAAGDFHHADEDSDHGEITTTDGAEVLLVGAVEDYLPGAP